MRHSSINDYLNLDSHTMKLIINEKHVVLLDSEDFPLISKHQWSIGTHGYATSGAGASQVLLHRLVVKAADSDVVDHINRDRLDNRKSNLRICSTSQNAYNKGSQSNCKSGYRGVALDQYGRWVAHININGKHTFLGSYSDPESAANAYDSAAALIAGEFAYRNLPDVPLRENIFQELQGLRRTGRLSKEEYDSILQFYYAGHSKKEIASMVGRSYDSVRRVIDRGEYTPWHRRT